MTTGVGVIGVGLMGEIALAADTAAAEGREVLL